MRICHISTFWPNRFGLTHYTDALMRGMRQNRPEQHLVAAEGDSEPRETEAYRCVPCFRREQDYVEPIIDTARSLGAEVALIQYTNDVMGDDDRIVRLLGGLRASGIKAVALCHSIYPAHWRSGYRPGGTAGSLDRALAEAADCLVVHSERMRRDLLARQVSADKLAVIPHGTEICTPGDRGECRTALGVPTGAKVVLFFGFIWLGKGLDFLLEAFARVARRLPEAFLYVGGYTRHRKLYTRAYMAYLRARLWQLGIARRTRMWDQYVPDEMVPTIFSAADLVAFPYRQDYSSVSGVVHQAVGYDRLVLCSRIAKFEEIGEVSPQLVAGAKDLDGWASGITRLLADQTTIDELRPKLRRFAEQTHWEVVGRRHLALYQGLLEGKGPSEALAAAAS